MTKPTQPTIKAITNATVAKPNTTVSSQYMVNSPAVMYASILATQRQKNADLDQVTRGEEMRLSRKLMRVNFCHLKRLKHFAVFHFTVLGAGRKRMAFGQFCPGGVTHL